MTTLPLADVRVLDLADHVGEAATRLLADLGADVIKLEPPGGSPTRGTRMVDGIGLDHAVSNANKRHGTIDRADGLDALLDLAASADVVVLGRDATAWIDPAGLLDRLPHLVVVVSSPFGRTGPRADWVATDHTLMALSGAVSRSGRPGDDPLLPPDGIATATAATQAAWLALVGLVTVRGGGPGQVIDLSHHEAVVTGLDPAFGVQGSAAAGRSGTVRRGRPPADSYPVYACADGYVRLCLLAKRQWHGMRGWLGEPDELMDPALDSIVGRVKAAALIEPRITALFADQHADDLVDEAARRGVPLARVLTLGEAAAAEHFVKAGTVAPVELAPGVVAMTPVGCVDVDGERLGIRAAAPPAPVPSLPAWRERHPLPPARPSGSDLPLAGVRVLDLGVIVFGAEIGRAFADLGADVIKVESLTFPDGLRQTRGGEAMNASFAWGQRNKQSLGLDLRIPEGRELFLRLAAASDVVLSNFKPGTLDSLGIGHETLSAGNPAIVVMESAAFSSRGPWSPRLGYGPLVRSACGISSLWRYTPDDAECWDGITVFPDHVAARVGAIAVAAAVLRARTSGVGTRIELAQSDVVLHQLAAAAAQESLRPGSVRATGNVGTGGIGGLLPCAGDDEWCVVEPVTDVQVAALHDLVGGTDLAAWTTERSPAEVMDAMQRAGVPAAAMLRLPELLDDAQLVHRGTFARLRHPALDHDLPTEDITSPLGIALDAPLDPAPAVGEHTREIARELLALDDATIDQLIASGALHEGATS